MNTMKCCNLFTGNITFGSHSLHEITMYYPMRSARTAQFALIENLAHLSPFPIDQDFYLSPSFQDLLNRTRDKRPTRWFKSLDQYYYRKRYELYDVIADPLESRNLAGDPGYRKQFERLLREMRKWQNATLDPFRCLPGGVLEDAGAFKSNPQCFPLLQNGIL